MHRVQYDSPLGPLVLRSNGAALTSLQFGAAAGQGNAGVFTDAFRWIDAYFAHKSAELPRLALVGTPFRLRVWQQCLSIPRGHTMSYGEMAAAIGQPGAARAVGSALGANPLLLMIPCHRVLPAGGGIGGYAAGAAVKRVLLEWESIDKYAVRV